MEFTVPGGMDDTSVEYSASYGECCPEVTVPCTESSCLHTFTPDVCRQTTCEVSVTAMDSVGSSTSNITTVGK